MSIPERPLSVSDAMTFAKGALENVRLRVLGEVSEVASKPGYKAVYFCLKDGASVMPCLMWRDAYDASGVTLEDGRLVEVSGFFTAYAAKGRLQFQVRQIVMAGEGVLRMQVAALARQLEAEGLFEEARKRSLPLFPQRIGVVTSPHGKAVHDILRTLRRRYPIAEVSIAGVQVEGEGAIGQIVHGLEVAGRAPGVEVIVLGRGGGSYEDLMPFNSEEVARAVADCAVPVVTGIGHEPDTCIADMVADVRASTPTAAAEAVAPDIAELGRRLQSQRRMLGRALSHMVTGSSHRLKLIAQRPVFCDADALLGARSQALDGLAEGLDRALPALVGRLGVSLEMVVRSLGRLGPQLTATHEQHLARAREKVLAVGQEMVAAGEREIAAFAARLDDLSPLAILGRGYAVCYEKGGAILRSIDGVSPGQQVRVRLANGSLGCTVDQVEVEE
ncbi:MAG: exodeoxyribonuclease VII large subunit [Coriobacteriia bacterium]|nr:exodeoxyribonuclease VII large subunit [Coriobacteriia bacterium]